MKMNPINDAENQNEQIIEIEEENSVSIDEFIRQLEKKEKDLQISSDMSIEIDEVNVNDVSPLQFIKTEFEMSSVKSPEAPVAANTAQNKRKFAELEKEIAELKAKIAQSENERLELTQAMRRRQADFDNFKKRIERDRSETFVNQISNLAVQILPVLDNLNRALDFAESHAEGKSSDFHEFYRGIVLVNQQLNEILAEMGVVPIPTVGEYFDPHFHEAVAIEEKNDVPPNVITDELLRGYRIGNKVIRAAMVKVSTQAKAESPLDESIFNNSEDPLEI